MASTPRAIAGGPSVRRLIQRSWRGRRGTPRAGKSASAPTTTAISERFPPTR